MFCFPRKVFVVVFTAAIVYQLHCDQIATDFDLCLFERWDCSEVIESLPCFTAGVSKVDVVDGSLPSVVALSVQVFYAVIGSLF